MTTDAPGPGGRAPAPPARSVGIDAEQTARFDKLAAGEKPWRLVYSPGEAAHLAAQPNAALAFCFAFCCKEALCKALGQPYSFFHLECFYLPGAARQRIVLAPGMTQRHRLAEVSVLFHERFLEDRGECLVEVHLRRGAAVSGEDRVRTLRLGAGEAAPEGARLESLAVAAVAAERGRIEDECFSPPEIADLGQRRVQSLAGFLALKRALAGIWGDAGVEGVNPRGFVLGHHEDGAPRILAGPLGVAPERVLISISHTRQWAYAAAALDRTDTGEDRGTD